MTMDRLRVNEKLKRKILVICLDGATFDLIGPLLDKRMLPNINFLIDHGIRGNLMSVYPPVTPSAWATFITGKNPGKHGIFGFSDPKFKEEVKVVSNSSINSESLWSIFSRHNMKVGILNIP